MSTPSSASKSKRKIDQQKQAASFLRIVSMFPKYTALHSRRCENHTCNRCTHIFQRVFHFEYFDAHFNMLSGIKYIFAGLIITLSLFIKYFSHFIIISYSDRPFRIDVVLPFRELSCKRFLVLEMSSSINEVFAE